MTQNNENRHLAEEIDLRELVRALWSSKALIGIFTLIVTLLAITYAFSSTPIYQTTAQTLPPTAAGLTSYNIASQLTGSPIRGTVTDIAPGIEPLTPQEAYRTFLRYLNSSSIRQEFFEQYYLPAQESNDTEGSKQRAWNRLNDELTISLPRNRDEYEASLTLRGENPQIIAEWANNYLELAIKAARDDLLQGLTGEVAIREQSLDKQIRALREIAEQIRQDSITRLQSALSIAEKIGLETPADGAPLIAIGTQGLNTENVNSGSLLYLRGAKALRSELQQLQQREENDAFIAELPELLKKQALLRSINFDPKLLMVTTVDRAAIAPEDPVKPRKALIILLGIIFGGALGIFIVLIRQCLRP